MKRVHHYASWDVRYRQLIQYQKKFGELPDFKSRNNNKEVSILHNWVRYQKERYRGLKGNMLKPEQIQKLENITGWIWNNGADDRWIRRFKLLKEYLKINNNKYPFYSKKEEDKDESNFLARWLMTQIIHYRQKKISHSKKFHNTRIRIKYLESLPDWSWKRDFGFRKPLYGQKRITSSTIHQIEQEYLKTDEYEAKKQKLFTGITSINFKFNRQKTVYIVISVHIEDWKYILIPRPLYTPPERKTQLFNFNDIGGTMLNEREIDLKERSEDIDYFLNYDGRDHNYDDDEENIFILPERPSSPSMSMFEDYKVCNIDDMYEDKDI